MNRSSTLHITECEVSPIVNQNLQCQVIAIVTCPMHGSGSIWQEGWNSLMVYITLNRKITLLISLPIRSMETSISKHVKIILHWKKRQKTTKFTTKVCSKKILPVPYHVPVHLCLIYALLEILRRHAEKSEQHTCMLFSPAHQHNQHIQDLEKKKKYGKMH